MQRVFTSMTMPAVVAGALTNARHDSTGPLAAMLRRVKLDLVDFSAQDLYQVCTGLYNNDTLRLMQDADFMRGLNNAFARADQTLLTPFQVSLVTDTLRKAGLFVTPKALAVPEEDAVSPESLLEVLRAMNVTKTRDERKITLVLEKMNGILDDFAPGQLAQAIVELAQLRGGSSSGVDLMARLATRALRVSAELGVADVCLVAKHLALTKGISFHVTRRFFTLAESLLPTCQAEDYLVLLQGLQKLGPRYLATFAKLVEAGLDEVESLDAITLTNYLVCFTALEYKQREHIEIYADALVDVAGDLAEYDLVQAFIALQRLQLLGEAMFATMTECLARYASRLETRLIVPVIDVCGSVPHDSEKLMGLLLARLSDCYRGLSAPIVADILDGIGLYPPARGHPVVALLGRQARLRLEVMAPASLARATRGLAQLGYNDVEYYVQAAETGFRMGFKDWSFLEPILMGLALSAETSEAAEGGAALSAQTGGGSAVPIQIIRVIAAHLTPMVRSMSLQDIERVSRYLRLLHCEEEFVYRSMATRVTHFVKEITPSLSEELRFVLQRGAVAS